MAKTGVLLLNLGTPTSPTPQAVGDYLNEFLMDPYVIDRSFLLRFLLVKVLIVPRRKYKSAEAYKKIWTEEGSPLLRHTDNLTRALRDARGGSVEFAMRYGTPSIQGALNKLRAAGITQLIVVPLYPQYALSSTESSIFATTQALKRMSWKIQPTILRDFFDRDEFIHPLARMFSQKIDMSKTDKVVFSFHGLPVRHVKKVEVKSGSCCVKQCCEKVGIDNRLCYRAQCFATARKIANLLKLPSEKYLVTFQSRLGTTKWIEPYTDVEIPKLVASGVKNIAVLCPSFVCDCLETLEEIDIRARADFLKVGGENFNYVPCLNSNEDWVHGLANLILGLQESKPALGDLSV